MQVRLTTSAVINGYSHDDGDVVELPAAEAGRWLARGLAVPVEGAETADETAPIETAAARPAERTAAKRTPKPQARG